MRCIAVAVIGLILAALAPVARADDPKGLALAREVVETAHVGDTMIKLMPTFIGQMRQLLSQQGAEVQQVDAFLVEFQQRFNDGIPNFIDLSSLAWRKPRLIWLFQSKINAASHLKCKQTCESLLSGTGLCARVLG